MPLTLIRPALHFIATDISLITRAARDTRDDFQTFSLMPAGIIRFLTPQYYGFLSRLAILANVTTRLSK